ncbi:MAG: cohesin domain-containing protein, partial [Bacteroidota bacterium]
EVLVSCDAALGQAHCSTAEIFPQENCLPPDPLWDGGSLEVSASCDGDSVRFEVQNIGDDMDAPVQYFIIVDDMVQISADDLQLVSSETKNFSFDANGSTWRIEVDQVANHPGASQPSAFVEGCGVNGNGGFSLGFVNQFPLDDANLNIDRDCQPNIGAFDPNDKRGYPNGYGVAHFIEPGTDVEYMIRFQNTGTDTAFNIVVADTLSPFFDPASVLPGVSSHSYQFELLGENILRFTFKDILLPDSNVNEAGSHGFVKFRISQRADVPIGTTIFGSAAIYFDFNEPVITNTTYHTVGEDYLMGQLLNLSGTVNTPFGAPAEGVKMSLSNFGETMTDPAGQFAFAGLTQGGDFTLSASKENHDPQRGVTVLDVVKVRSHILSIDPLARLDDLLAADLNNSFGVTTFDIVLMNKIILGSDLTLAPDWKFLAANWSPPVPASNLGSAPGSYFYNDLSTSLDQQNFTAIQPGDVVDESEVDSAAVHPIFYFTQGGVHNQTIQVEVKASNFTAMNAFQFGLQWDASVLEFSDATGGALHFYPGSNSFSPSPGKLSLTWLNTDGNHLTLPDDTTLFVLTFNVLGDIGNSTPLAIDPSSLPFQAVVEGCKLAEAGIVEQEILIQSPTAVSPLDDQNFEVKLSPNPVKSGQPLLLEVLSASGEELTVQVFDAAGKMIRMAGGGGQ